MALQLLGNTLPTGAILVVLIVGGFVLFLVTLALNFIALRVVKRFREAYE